jgi:hypothetical protein
MTAMHTDRGAVQVSGDLSTAWLPDLRRMISDYFALPGTAGTEALILDLSGVGECAPELRDELARALLVCAEHDAGLRIVPSASVRRALGDDA